MEDNQILDHLFFINNELKLEEADQFFEQLGFHYTTKENSILSYMCNDASDVNGISWYTVNLDNCIVMNSNFRTTKEINLESILNYAKAQHRFSFGEEVDNAIIYKRDKLQLHIRTLTFPESAFNKVMYAIYLFEHAENQVKVAMMQPPSNT